MAFVQHKGHLYDGRARQACRKHQTTQDPTEQLDSTSNECKVRGVYQRGRERKPEGWTGGVEGNPDGSPKETKIEV